MISDERTPRPPTIRGRSPPCVRAFSEMHGSSSSYLFLLNLFLGVLGAYPLQPTRPSLPEKFAQLQSSAEDIEEAKENSLEKVFDCSKKVEKVEKEEALEKVDGAHRSTGLIGRRKRSPGGIPEDAIMRSLRSSSIPTDAIMRSLRSSNIPEEAIMRSLRSPNQMSRVIRQGVQNHAILR